MFAEVNIFNILLILLDSFDNDKKLLKIIGVASLYTD